MAKISYKAMINSRNLFDFNTNGDLVHKKELKDLPEKEELVD
jgi:hypothetical protein